MSKQCSGQPHLALRSHRPPAEQKRDSMNAFSAKHRGWPKSREVCFSSKIWGKNVSLDGGGLLWCECVPLKHVLET
jgi:hypothetical protein